MPDVILNPRPVATIFNANIQADSTTSLTAVGAKAISFNGLAAGMTDLKIQARLSDDGDWIAYADVPLTNPSVIINFPTPYNRARVVGLVAGVTVVAQG